MRVTSTPSAAWYWHPEEAEIDREARVGERALKSIEVGEHAECFKIHTAMLNLEKAHGDEGTLAKAVSRARTGGNFFRRPVQGVQRENSDSTWAQVKPGYLKEGENGCMKIHFFHKAPF